MKKTIEAFAEKHNCIIGLCSAEPLARGMYTAGFTPFVSKNIEKRTNPATALKGAQCVMVVGVGQDEENGAPSEPSDSFEPPHMARLSSLGQGTDYHVRVKSVLRELVNVLRKSCDFRYKILVDSPGLDERALAVRAGLGFYGRHGLVVSQKFGTRFHIGCLVVDVPFEENVVNAVASSCSACPPECRRCISACPTGALAVDRPLDARRCVSYLTQKETLDAEEKVMLGNQLYGCDICQDACPFNAPRRVKWVDPAEFLLASDEYFALQYGKTAMMWRGAAILRRNAQAVIDNCKKAGKHVQPPP